MYLFKHVFIALEAVLLRFAMFWVCSGHSRRLHPFLSGKYSTCKTVLSAVDSCYLRSLLIAVMLCGDVAHKNADHRSDGIDSDDASGHFVLDGGNGGSEASGTWLAVCPCR